MFDKAKLSWMNGQHLKALGDDQVNAMVAAKAVEQGIVKSADSPFILAAIKLVRGNLELVSDAESHIRSLLSYPLEETAASEDAKAFVDDNIKEVLDAVIASADAGELQTAVKGGHDTFKVRGGEMCL